MSGPLRGLDDICPKCGRRTGDHTLDEYNRCSERPAMDLPYEDVPDGPIPLMTVAGAEMAWADHLHARAAVVGGDSGPLSVKFSTVIFTFEIGNPRGPAVPIAEVAFVSNPPVLRKLGTILRDTCNAAANAAERTA